MGVIMHKGVAYGGGSNVEANPAGSSTDDISKLGIDSTVYDVTDADAVHSADVGVASGVAGLDANGKVPSAQLPTYPTVNDGTLTIRKNGTTIATFTANQSGNATANISVPTQPSDINAAAESDIESTKTTSGNPITITDAAPINAESLVVELEPKQDLHGYSNPWVGGAGKNKFGFTASDFANGMVYGSAKRIAVDFPSGTYTASSNCPTGYLWVGTMEDWSYNRVYDGNPRTFTLSEGEQLYVAVNKDDVAGSLEYQNQIELGNQSTTFAPYTNICPISGYDEVEALDRGVNQWDEEWELGALNTSTGALTSSTTYFRSKNTISVEPQTTYRFKMADVFGYCFYDKDGNFISGSSSATLSQNITSPANAKILRFFCKGTTYGNNISINYPSTFTEYVPYHSSNATIQFGQTVYGGTVDFKTGVVTITDANIASYAGETLPSTWISDRDAYSSGGTPTTGAQVVYKLSTPTTLQLTPAELKLLQNTNNITTNGTTITLGYQPNNVVGELKGDIETEHERFYTETAEYAVTFLNNARCVILATSSSDYIPIAAYTDYLFVAIGQIGDNYVGYIKFPDMSEPSESELPIGTEIEFTVVFMRKE